MPVFSIVIQAQTGSARQNIKGVEDQLQRLSNSADRLRNLIRNIFIFTGINLGIRGLVNMADTFTLMQNRLRTVIDDTDELNRVMERLFDISKRTRTSLDATAVFFQRTAAATKNLGVTTQELLAVTESVNQ